MMGIIDLIDEEGLIIDHKTVGKSRIREWNQVAVDENMQLTWYAAAYRKLFNKKEKGVAIDVLPRAFKTDFLRIESTRTNEKVLQLLDIASSIEQLVDLGLFLPKKANCKNCEFDKICPKEPVFLPSAVTL